VRWIILIIMLCACEHVSGGVPYDCSGADVNAIYRYTEKCYAEGKENCPDRAADKYCKKLQ
jgi:hypothetical protein